MNNVLLNLFGSNDNILRFFCKPTLDECLTVIDEKYGHWQNFVNIHMSNIANGCTCNTINDIPCNTCYKFLVEQDVCNLRNLRNFYPEEFTNAMQVKYDVIVRECNMRQINMNSFVVM